jgi:lipoate-protein ligase A
VTDPAPASPAWRFISSGPGRGSWNLALDEAIFRSVRDGSRPPTVRCYAWDPPALSLGYAQDCDGTVDRAACRARGIAVVRRITGGGAVLHDDEVTYSVASGPAPALFGTGLVPAYRRIAGALVEALRELGVAAEAVQPGGGARSPRHPSCFAAAAGYEIAVGGRKIVGSAQRREGGAFLQQGSILLGGHGERLAPLLRSPLPLAGGGAGTGGIRAVLRPAPVPGAVVAALRRALARAFGADLRDGRPGEDELLLAAALERERYGAEAWTSRRSR